MWRRYLSAPKEADQVSVGVELVVLLSAGAVRLNEPGGLQDAAMVVNFAQPLVVNGHVLALVFFATTRHSYVVLAASVGGLKLVFAVVNCGVPVQAPDPDTPK